MWLQAVEKGRELGKPWEDLEVRQDVEYLTAAHIPLAIIQLQGILGNIVLLWTGKKRT